MTLARLECSPEGISLEIEQDRDFIYTTQFTGKDGVLLDEVTGLAAESETDGHEDYVRATIVSSAGPRAWTQPIFPDRSSLQTDDG